MELHTAAAGQGSVWQGPAVPCEVQEHLERTAGASGSISAVPPSPRGWLHPLPLPSAAVQGELCVLCVVPGSGLHRCGVNATIPHTSTDNGEAAPGLSQGQVSNRLYTTLGQGLFKAKGVGQQKMYFYQSPNPRGQSVRAGVGGWPQDTWCSSSNPHLGELC